MAFDLSKLVVVCMRCPANATLLLVEMEAYRDVILIWCECHGEHVLAALRGETITKARKQTPAGEPVRIGMQSMERIERDEAQRMRVEAQEYFLAAGKRLEALNHFLATEDALQPEPGPRYKHDDCPKCTFLGRFGVHDLYSCTLLAPGLGLIAREAEGEDYETVLVYDNSKTLDVTRYADDHPLSEALRRVIAREASA